MLPKKVVEAIGATIKLAETKQLATYNDGRIQVIGETNVTAVIRNQKYEMKILVVNEDQKPIL